MKKRLLILLVAPILLFAIYIIVNEPGPDAPMNIGGFNVIETSTIDPTTILSSLNHSDQNVFNFELGLPPDDPPFVTSIEWKQADFLNLAASIFRVAWNESVNDWRLYRMQYTTECDHPNGFHNGELYFYLETSNYMKYSGRGILMEPEYGYVVWGGDTYCHRPLFGWKAINLKGITVTAEEALRRAEASGGFEARQSWEECHVSVILWPDAFGDDWRVSYWDNDAYTTDEPNFWIPTK